MKQRFLKVIRVITALLFFIPILLYFCDFVGIMPESTHVLMQLQFIPAILKGSLLAIGIILLLTILFGRVYCSTICPLGILQDIFNRFSGRGRKKKKAGKKKPVFRYAKAKNYLRYGLLGICIVLLIVGITTPLLLLDPYSNFGRIASNLFRPLVIYINNFAHWIAIKNGIYSLYHVSIYTITTYSLFAALIALVTVFIFSLLRGRLFCNTICPVGTFLGLLSRFSLIQIKMDKVKCNSCGLCEKSCKSQCIDSRNKRVDNSRCVDCYNCLSTCKHNGIRYRYAWKKEAQTDSVAASEACKIITNPKPVAGVQSSGRRAFFATGTAIVVSLPLIPVWAKDKDRDTTKDTPITPPGSKSLKNFTEKCTACHLCVTHCPQQVLVPAGMNFGFSYLLKPHLVYKTAYCNFECKICSEVCPNGAITALTVEEKKTTQIGIAKFETERCVVYLDETDCGACSEHCPTQAVHMVPYKDGLRIPKVTENLCVGCGGCEYICPAVPIKAINVLANTVHAKSQKPHEEEIKEIKVDDFGF